ncbi:RNA polymerase sigma factor [Taibaiella lutea]|uniref:RNA polymerase sigma factor n=1 Tax=Taibaiella lutea TaxID=2608001 RepID=UPI00167FDFE7|nr:RNA polymerase sigma factor [Taibaiella lutea]
MNNETLIGLVAKGDERAFNELYHKFKDDIYKLSFYYLQNKEDAEDVLQEIFVTVYKRASTFKSNSSFSTWLYRIAVNKCLDKLKYLKARKRLALFTHFFHPAGTSDNAPYSDEDLNLLHNTIDKLLPQQKTALILTQIQELSINETAAIMNLSSKAVESLTQRAKANLRKKMKK